MAYRDITADEHPELFMSLRQYDKWYSRKMKLQVAADRRKKEDDALEADKECLRRFVTINKHPDTDQRVFLRTVHRQFQKGNSSLKSGVWVFEQRSEDPNEYKGIHCHALLEYAKDWRIAIRELKKACALVCDTENASCFNVLPCLDKDVPKRLLYMDKEEVKDEIKYAKHLVDLCWRKEYNIQDVYMYPVPEGQILIGDNN